MSDVDWSRYRMCPACIAPLGEPCKSLDGLVVDGVVTEVRIEVRARPHNTRKLRTSALRNGGN